MAVGDVKGDEAIILTLLSTGGVTKGQVVHCENDGHWEIGASGDLGPWAVAIETALTGVEFRAVVFGPVEVAYSGTDDCPKGGPLMHATDTAANGGAAGTVSHATGTATGLVIGTAMELMDTSANTYTMWVGMGGT